MLKIKMLEITEINSKLRKYDFWSTTVTSWIDAVKLSSCTLPLPHSFLRPLSKESTKCINAGM
jgi:hypothetical protein